jgi:antitoxin component YwqK of YwqJK toxin-antitoxin module
MKKFSLVILFFVLISSPAFSQLSHEPLASLTAANMASNRYTLYYENGSIEEVGHWKNYHNVGEFKRYHKNGKLAQHFNFTTSGKRDGVQKYFYENGSLRIIGKWRNGNPVGLVKVYNQSGELIEAMDFSSGKIESRYFDLISF